MNLPLTKKSFAVGKHNIQLLIPDVASVQKAYQNGSIALPYWSQVWPSSIALAEFISKHPHLVREKEVLELGAGLGLPSMVAAHYAKLVVCSDYEPQAVELIDRSAQLNRLKNLHADGLDWNSLPPHLKPDVLLLSDINYAQEAFEKLSKALDNFLENGTTIILSTPQRLMAKDFIAPLLQDGLQQEETSAIQGSTAVAISILVLKR